MHTGKIDTFKGRLAKALSLRGMKQVELSRLTSIDSGTVNNYLSGKYEPKQNRLETISKVLNVDPVWLMGFDVPMEREKKVPDKLELNEDDKAILEIFRLIPEEQRRAFLEMGRAYANSLKKD